MRNRCFLSVAIGLMLLGSVGRGAIAQLNCMDRRGHVLPPDLWDFDFDNQILTLMEERYSVPDDPYDYHFTRDNGVEVDGYTTYPPHTGTFTVVRNITNMSSVAWTAFVMEFAPDHNTGAQIVDGSEQCYVFPEVTVSYGGVYREFSGSGSVLPGEVLAIQFDIHIDATHSFGVFGIWLTGEPVPEPVTVLLVGLGAVGVVRRRG